MSASVRLSTLANSAFRTSGVVWFLAACFFALLFAGSANAQCGVNTVQFSNIGIVPENPFQAEYVTTSSIPAAFEGVSRTHPPELVARDSQGRVRIEHAAGKFEMDTGAQAGSEQERHIISICDPVKQTLTQIDTLNKTAQIRHSRPSAPSSSRRFTSAQKTVCIRILPRMTSGGIMQVEDLGHRTIEGLDAQGVRITMKSMIGSQTSEEGGALSTRSTLQAVDPAQEGGSLGASGFSGGSTQERWCSEELAVLVLQSNSNSRAETTSSRTLTNLERREPDPALFQIPADYTVSETVAQPLGSRER
jgi:hypothetical protein